MFLTRDFWEIRRFIRKSKNNYNIVFLDVALLFEMKWDKFCDYIILADVDKEIQKSRVIKRDNISENDFEKIDNIQLSQSEKKKMVDFIINTDVNKNKLRVKIVNTLWDIKEYAEH